MFNVAKALENFCNAYEGEVTFYPDYSGRCMYGRTCPGITVNDDLQPFEFALALADFVSETEEVTPYELGDMLGTSRVDSMGLGYIVYFPNAA